MTNDEYIESIKLNPKKLEPTPFTNIYLIRETSNHKETYKDEDGDWCTEEYTITDRMAIIFHDGKDTHFIVEHWFDKIFGFDSGIYSLVRIGELYNCIFPTGEYIILADNLTEHKIRNCKFVLNGTEKKISKVQDGGSPLLASWRIGRRAEPQTWYNNGGHRTVA